jgi:hypothetical protein
MRRIVHPLHVRRHHLRHTEATAARQIANLHRQR